MDFGDQIRKSREAMALSQEMAAKKIREKYSVRLSAAYLSMIERGVRLNITTKLKSALSEFFGIYIIDTTRLAALPVLGTIRAGLRLLDNENIFEYLDVPQSIAADFIVRVAGDSMIGVGILEGDCAICIKSDRATSGQIVVVTEDKGMEYIETKLGFYYKRGNGSILRPANPNYPEIHMTDNYHIAGIMAALIRQEAPGYQIYRDYLAIAGHDEWKEVIEAASLAGIKPGRLKSHVDMLIEMGKNSK